MPHKHWLASRAYKKAYGRTSLPFVFSAPKSAHQSVTEQHNTVHLKRGQVHKLRPLEQKADDTSRNTGVSRNRSLLLEVLNAALDAYVADAFIHRVIGLHKTTRRLQQHS